MSSIQKTDLETQTNLVTHFVAYFTDYSLDSLSFQLLSILLGFFTSTALSTIPAQTGDWGIVAAAIIVTNQEIVSKITYQKNLSKYYGSNKLLALLFKYCNGVKIGILYGLFVDAFKLGS